jgi:hypothetical protein
VFEPFLVAATELDHRGRDENRAALLAALLTILGRMGGSGSSDEPAEPAPRPRRRRRGDSPRIRRPRR